MLCFPRLLDASISRSPMPNVYLPSNLTTGKSRDEDAPNEGPGVRYGSNRNNVLVLPKSCLIYSINEVSPTNHPSTALAAALLQLGLKPYDWVDRFALGHLPKWDAALRAKFYGEGRPWGRREFDMVTKDFDVSRVHIQYTSKTDGRAQCILDTPCCFFAEELVTAYPDAKVILNYRDPEEWMTSMNNTIFKIQQWSCWKWLRYTDPSFVGAFYSHNLTSWNVFCDNEVTNREKCLQRYDEHYAHVREVVSKERLLEWVVTDGWDPLCEYLGIERPEDKFPNVNTGEEIVRHHIFIRNLGIFRTIVNVLTYWSVVWAPLLMWWIWLSWV